MWNPLRIIPLLSRIVQLQEEQNALLRELYVTLTGHHALTTRRSTPSPRVTRLRTASDVWQRTPLTVSKQQARDLARRETAARPPSANDTANG